MKENYAVLRLDKGTGNDSGVTPHIERRDAKGRVYVPENADPSKTHLNKELISFPDGVHTRTDAIMHRLGTSASSAKSAKIK